VAVGVWSRTPALLLAGLLATGSPAGVAEIRIAASEANASPFVLFDPAGRLHGGIARDIMAALAVELRRAPRFINAPRARVEPWLREGELDAACFLAPAWVEDATSLAWSPVLFHIQQVVVQPADSDRTASEQGFAGLRIATLLNFVYPELQEAFASGRMKRSDGASLDSNLQRLARGRVDAVVDVDIAVLYRQAQRTVPLQVRIDPLWAPASPVYCAFSPQFARANPQFLLLLEAMVHDGRIEAWIGRYTGGQRIGQFGNPHRRAVHRLVPQDPPSVSWFPLVPGRQGA